MSGAALSGIHAQAARLAAIANNVANAESEEYQPLSTQFQTTDSGVYAAVSAAAGANADLAGEMQALSEAELAYKANAAAFDAGADLWQLLSVVQRD
jgi:flagellar basal body rod protein FlgC